MMPPHSGGKHLWVRSNFAAVRTAGFRDRHSLFTEVGAPDFPFDYPETAAGEVDAATSAKASEEHYNRRPPANRVNFEVLGIPCPHTPKWELLSCHAVSALRPRVVRPALVGPKAELADGCLIAVTLRCPGRGVPKSMCHLFLFQDKDYPSFPSVGASANRKRSISSREVHSNVSDPPEWPGVSWDKMRLDEPLHKRHKRQRVRRREQYEAEREQKKEQAEIQPEQKDFKDGPIRTLVGFVSSGSYSHRNGRGVGVGTVAAQPFAKALRTQCAIKNIPARQLVAGDVNLDTKELPKHWVLLWGRNRTSLRYFPVWAQMLRCDTGLG